MTRAKSAPGHPRRVRPEFPAEWHVPNDPRNWITWDHADGKLEKEEVYWVSTTRPDGRPHAAPVWGIWTDCAFYFETDPQSVKGVNLARNPNVVVHLQDGNDTVIVHGRASVERSASRLKALQGSYTKKYEYTPDWSGGSGQVVYRVAPRVAHAWKNPRMHRSLVKFLF